MAFEVIDGLGQLRASDLRQWLGSAFLSTHLVEVFIAPGKTSPAFRGLVSLRLVPGGRGQHRRLVCPRCLQTRLLLHVSPRGQLACNQCLQVRSRRQLEHTCQSWTQFGGQAEDEIVRLLLKPGPPTEGRLRLAEQKIQELTRADHQRARALLTEARLLNHPLQS